MHKASFGVLDENLEQYISGRTNLRTKSVHHRGPKSQALLVNDIKGLCMKSRAAKFHKRSLAAWRSVVNNRDDLLKDNVKGGGHIMGMGAS